MYHQSEDVRAGVFNALYWDLRVPRREVRVEIENGWVTVSGTVDLPYQKTCAEFDARSVPGVLGVTNLFNSRPPNSPSIERPKAVTEFASLHPRRAPTPRGQLSIRYRRISR